MIDGRGYEALFDRRSDPQAELGHQYVSRYRTRTVDAGPMRYVEIYPMLRAWEGAGRAREKKRESREAQRRLNERNARKKIEWLFNENFCERDVFATLTFAAPVEEGEARDAVRRLIRRVRAYARRDTSGRSGEIKYIYVIEGKTGADEVERYHVHMVISGIGRGALEGLWEHGRANTRRLQPDENQFTGLAKYMTKQRRFARRWSCSKNLRRPREWVADHKISRRRVERLAAEMRFAADEIFGKIYPGYRLVEQPEIRTSDYVPGAFIYARMRRRD